MSETRATIRLDKWLWFARFFKTRSLSGKIVTGGHVRLNANKVAKAATPIGVGDTLTFSQAETIRVVRVVAIGTRRGPATEATTLYEDLSPPVASSPKPSTPLRKGRPSKQDRRRIIEFKEGANDRSRD